MQRASFRCAKMHLWVYLTSVCLWHSKLPSVLELTKQTSAISRVILLVQVDMVCWFKSDRWYSLFVTTIGTTNTYRFVAKSTSWVPNRTIPIPDTNHYSLELIADQTVRTGCPNRQANIDNHRVAVLDNIKLSCRRHLACNFGRSFQLQVSGSLTLNVVHSVLMGWVWQLCWAGRGCWL